MSTPRARRRHRRNLLVGVIGLTVGIALTTVAFLSTQGLPFAPRSTYQIAFDTVGSMRAGDDARIANIRVGYVEKIELVERPKEQAGSSKQAVVTIRLDGERQLYRNAQAVTAAVRDRSALGQKFVELNPGDPAAGPLPAGSVIPSSETVQSQEISDLLAVFDLPTRQSMGSFIRNFGGGLIGHGGDLADGLDALPDLLPDLGTVSLALANQGGRDFASLLRSANSLSVSFAGRQEQIGQLLGKTDQTFAALNTDGGQPLAETLQTAPEALRNARTALQSLDAPLADTAAAMRELRPGGEALGEATPDVRGVFREGRSPLDKVPGVSDDAQPAFEDLRDVADDARPLAPMLTKTFDRGGSLAQVISPFSPEAALFFINAADSLGNGNDNYHWLRFVLTYAHPEQVSLVPIRSPGNTREPYPAPGQSPKDQTKLPVLGGGVLGR